METDTRGQSKMRGEGFSDAVCIGRNDQHRDLGSFHSDVPEKIDSATHIGINDYYVDRLAARSTAFQIPRFAGFG